jgi:hypothetical protein
MQSQAEIVEKKIAEDRSAKYRGTARVRLEVLGFECRCSALASSLWPVPSTILGRDFQTVPRGADRQATRITQLYRFERHYGTARQLPVAFNHLCESGYKFRAMLQLQYCITE